MSKLVFGSARHDENNKYAGGKAGDQTTYEVSTQALYMNSKGWYILRPKNKDLANGLSFGMLIACGNENIGYDQNERLGVIAKSIFTTTKTECDCSSLVRAVLRANNVNVGNFTTVNELTTLLSTGLFDKIDCTSTSQMKKGDILITKTKGHTGIVCEL